MKHQFDSLAEQWPYDAAAPEQHHGDLRKGAYLQRRAAYQLEAKLPKPTLAAGITTAAVLNKTR
ncbi:MAG: hypothetical protein H6955_13620 [Chromatiaceae bacterium]|nr:hypothetical protein [Gammaproteobacteria bacterium]MCP5314590.1 hypothetical protein [Chromatiaceae bacterium]